jgi:tetratricopeptide (TPR) repeat protein
MRQYENAAHNLQKACDLDPDSPRYHYFYGRALFELGKNAAAGGQFARVLSLQPDHYRALTYLGGLSEKRGNRAGAFALYKKALLAGPDRAAEAYNNMAILLLDAPRTVPLALAFAHTAHAIGDEKMANATSSTLSEALIKADYPALALRPARLAARVNPRDAKQLLHLGLAEASTGNKERAMAALNKALEMTDEEERREKIEHLIDALREENEAPASGTKPAPETK